MVFPCSKRAPCFFVTLSSARTAAMATAGCASKRNRFLFIFRIGQRASRQPGYTICITSRPSMKQIGQGKRKSPRGKLRVAARVITQRGSLTLADSVPGLLLHRGDFFARSCADVAQRQIYKSGFDESRLNDITVGMLRDQLGLRAALPSANTADVGLFLLWCIPSVLAWLPLPFLTLILFWLIVRSKF